VIKQFLPQARGTSTINQTALDQAVRLFNQEAMRLDELGEHSQIPTLLAYFEDHSRLYLVQQFIEGQTLLQELQYRGRFDEAGIRELLQDLLPVLRFVHDRQVIHRDIKPTNILRRNGDRRFVLIDFGIAKQITPDSLTLGGTKIGTEGYAPVEQWRSGRAFPASDLYSLGATCAFLLTCIRPDELYEPIRGCWLWQECLERDGITISPQLAYILDKLLKDAVNDRYQTADQVLQDLQIPVGQASSVLPFTTLPIIPRSATPPIPQIWLGAYTLREHQDRIRCLGMHPAGDWFASGSNDRTIRLWDLATGKLLKTLQGHTEPVHAIAISPSGKTLVSAGSDKTICLWHVESGRLLHTLTAHTKWVNALAATADGLMFVSAGDDKTLKRWNLEAGSLLQSWTGHSSSIYALAISPDSKLVASAGNDREIKLWELETGTYIRTFSRHSSRVTALAISPDGQTLASASHDGSIKLWNLATGKLFNTLTHHQEAVNSIAIGNSSYDPGNYILVSGSSDETVNLWDVTTGKLLCSLPGNTSAVNAVTISPNGNTIISGSADRTIYVWRLSA
jgi:serine/threonine protein kinase